MADAAFKIHLDHSRGLIEITLIGQWTLRTVADFRLALVSAYSVMASKGYPAGKFCLLSHSQNHGVQTQQVMAELDRMAQEFAKVARKTAVIVASVLHKMQVDRVFGSDKIRTFTDYDEAIAWLYE